MEDGFHETHGNGKEAGDGPISGWFWGKALRKILLNQLVVGFGYLEPSRSNE
jgi:hypothetical protein